jgi:hypothetical protein
MTVQPTSRIVLVFTMLLFAACRSTIRSGNHPDRPLSIQVAEGAGEIEVRAFTNGSPLPGCVVELCPASGAMITTATSANGDVRVSVPNGRWVVRVSLSGFQSSSALVEVKPDERVIATATIVVMDVPPVTIAEPPDFWTVHGPFTSTLYNYGGAWPVPWR